MMTLLPIPSINSEKYLTGQTPKLGDIVMVKVDQETQGRVTQINGNEIEVFIFSESLNMPVRVEVFASDCWIS